MTVIVAVAVLVVAAAAAAVAAVLTAIEALVSVIRRHDGRNEHEDEEESEKCAHRVERLGNRRIEMRCRPSPSSPFYTRERRHDL